MARSGRGPRHAGASRGGASGAHPPRVAPGSRLPRPRLLPLPPPRVMRLGLQGAAPSARPPLLPSPSEYSSLPPARAGRAAAVLRGPSPPSRRGPRPQRAGGGRGVGGGGPGARSSVSPPAAGGSAPLPARLALPHSWDSGPGTRLYCSRATPVSADGHYGLTPQPWDSFPGPGLSVPFAQVTAMLASRPQSGEAWPVAGLWGKDRVNPETMGSLHAFSSLP